MDGGVKIISKDILSNVLVYNMAGALVKTKKINSKETVIQTSNLSKGIYMFEVTYKDKLQNNHIKVALK